MGSLEEKDGANYVRDDFILATAADIVADPSAPDAFVDGIMEGKEWVWEGGILKERQIAELKNRIDTAPSHELQEQIVKAFEAYISNKLI